MAVYFKDFDKARDWRTLVEDLSLASASAILSFIPVNLYKGAKDAVAESEPTPGIDERAGIWLRVTATTALLDLLNDPAHGGPIRHDPDCKDAAKVFVNERLTLDGSVPFEPAALDNLGGSPGLATVRADLPSLVPTADAESLRLAYDARLRKNTARVFALDPDLYGPLEAALQGAFSGGWRRDQAWTRHGNWVRSLFHSEPIFSPDRTEERPLSAV